MKFLILCLCSLSGFNIKADGTFCLSCTQPGNEICKVEEIFCPKDSKCVTISETYNKNGTIHHSLHKGCAGDFPCDTQVYSSVNTMSVAQNIECCSGNCCNTGMINVPPDDSKAPNGRVCPYCFQLGLEECNATEVRMCRGSQNKCLEYIGRVRNEDGTETDCSLKSCTSPLVCEIGISTFLGFDEEFHTVLNCT